MDEGLYEADDDGDLILKQLLALTPEELHRRLFDPPVSLHSSETPFDGAQSQQAMNRAENCCCDNSNNAGVLQEPPDVAARVACIRDVYQVQVRQRLLRPEVP